MASNTKTTKGKPEELSEEAKMILSILLDNEAVSPKTMKMEDVLKEAERRLKIKDSGMQK